MKNIIQEKNLLPLTFQYLEVFEKEKFKVSNNIVFYVKCEMCSTDFYKRTKPNKNLTRLI
ncbi:hypothetical protein NBC122_02772 [Chryseobacterium salivictor]|uniref:Uncharacterized protein n=1 Tax=Chryseobacterium salivictor TaxID=2547600 RepID=A0A4P6ZIK0_9FLAO|nr:hypothetical protein NBC122_02772 [Chryseobacterium salivictor]